MKTLATTLFLSLALAGVGAQAAGVEQAKSSAQVATELHEAKVSGQYTFGELQYPPVAAATGAAKSRADVQQELAQAKASGQYTFGELEYPPISR